MVTRDPPSDVKLLLRKEVNFGCPVRFRRGGGCGCPILTYHHFDPPWSSCHTHDPQGMIALCPKHHPHADGGLWTKAQLKTFKKNPFVNDVIHVAWPWTSETLIMKVGPSIIAGSGSAMRLDGRPVMRFYPREIDALGIRTVEFESDVRDENGRQWLTITESSFDLSLEGTTDLDVPPQAHRIVIRHKSGAYLHMQYRAIPFDKLLPLLRRSMTNADIAESATNSIERVGGIDSDGNVPFVTFEGVVRSRHIEVSVKKNRMHFESQVPALQPEFDWHSWVVNDVHRAIIRIRDGPELFSLG